MTLRLPFVIAVAALLCGWLIYHLAAPEPLEFADVSRPAGFRALVLHGEASRFDPAIGAMTENDARDAAVNGETFCSILWRADRGMATGGLNAAVTIVEFFDYRCPYCKVLAELLPELQMSLSVRIIYKEWPILGESSLLGARAALAAAGQGRYLDFHEKLMQARFLPTAGYVEDLGRRLGLDQARLLEDMASDWVSATIDENRALAASLGLAGTPALVVGRTIVQGAISRDELERLIETESASAPPCGQG